MTLLDTLLSATIRYATLLYSTLLYATLRFYTLLFYINFPINLWPAAAAAVIIICNVVFSWGQYLGAPHKLNYTIQLSRTQCCPRPMGPQISQCPSFMSQTTVTLEQWPHNEYKTVSQPEDLLVYGAMIRAVLAETLTKTKLGESKNWNTTLDTCFQKSYTQLKQIYSCYLAKPLQKAIKLRRFFRQLNCEWALIKLCLWTTKMLTNSKIVDPLYILH
jgi:hypothetical protein